MANMISNVDLWELVRDTSQVFSKNVCYVKLYPKPVKLEQHGEPLIDTFGGMDEEDLI